MPRELKKLDVTFISLVKKPANNEKLILKNVDKPTMFELVKSDDELKIAYGIVYSPDKEDLQGDTATAETIRKAAQIFMKEGRHQNIDTNHQFAKVPAYVAETWIVKSDDPMFPNDEGAWAVGIKIEDETLWKGLKDGKFTGISLAGTASVDPVEKNSMVAAFEKWWNKEQEEDMPEEELKRIEKENVAFRKEFKTEIIKDIGKVIETKFKEFQKAADNDEKSKKIDGQLADLKKAITDIKADGTNAELQAKFDQLEKSLKLQPTEEDVTKTAIDNLKKGLAQLAIDVNKKGSGESGIDNGNGSFM